MQDTLEDWEEIGPPTAQYQRHYLLDEAAQALRLTPITIRQYIRKGKISARKVGRKWVIPIDAIARFMYNSSGKTANPAVPMGVVYVWADEGGELLVDYQIVGNLELSAFDSSQTVASFMGIEAGPLWCVLLPALAPGAFLEDLNLISPGISQEDRSPYYNRPYSPPHATAYKVVHLSLQ